MPDIVKMGLKLFIITVIAALGLSLTNLATAGPIEEQKINAANEMRRAVLPEADSFESVEVVSEYSDQNKLPYIYELYAGKSGDEIVGYTFRILSKGYGGDIEIIVGINAEGKIEAVQIGELQETPGLGAKAAEESFTNQYSGKSVEKPLEVVKGKASSSEQIEAISGATITSRAVTEGVNTAIEYYNNVLKAGGGAQ